MKATAFLLLLLICLSNPAFAKPLDKWVLAGGKYHHTDYPGLVVKVSPAYYATAADFEREFNVRRSQLEWDYFSQSEILGPAQRKGAVLSQSIQGQLNRTEGFGVVRLLAFFAADKAVFTETFAPSQTLIQRQQDAFQVLLKTLLPSKLNSPVSLKPVEAGGPEPGAQVAKSPGVASDKSRQTSYNLLPRYQLPKEYEGIYCAADSGFSAQGNYVYFYPLYLLKDGSAARDVTVAPDKLDISKSRKEHPVLWGKWRHIDDGYEVTFHGEDGEYESVVSYESKLLPFRMGERLNRTIKSSFATGTLGLSPTTVSTDRIHFDFEGRFSIGSEFSYASSSLGSGAMDVAAGSRRSADGGSTSVTATGNGVDVSLISDQQGNDLAGSYQLSGYTLNLSYRSGKRESVLVGFCDENRERIMVGQTLYRYEKNAIEDAVPFTWKIHLDEYERSYFVPNDLAAGEVFRFSVSDRHALSGRSLKEWLEKIAKEDSLFLGAQSVIDGEFTTNGQFGLYGRSFVDVDGRSFEVIYTALQSKEGSDAAYTKIVVSDSQLLNRYIEDYRHMTKKLVKAL